MIRKGKTSEMRMASRIREKPTRIRPLRGSSAKKKEKITLKTASVHRMREVEEGER